VTATPISQISDGQPQAPTAAIHAGNATMSAATASSSPTAVAANAGNVIVGGSSFGAIIAAFVAAALL
jgi:hypothetical protein